MSHASGTTLLATPPLDPHDLERLAVLETVDVDRARLERGAIAASSGAARWIALTPIHGRAVWARAPANVAADVNRALAPASTHPLVGSSRIAKSPATQLGVARRTGGAGRCARRRPPRLRRTRSVTSWSAGPAPRPSASCSSTASPPFMSAEPRPCSMSPSRRGLGVAVRRARCRDARRARPAFAAAPRRCGRRHCSRRA